MKNDHKAVIKQAKQHINTAIEEITKISSELVDSQSKLADSQSKNEAYIESLKLAKQMVAMGKLEADDVFDRIDTFVKQSSEDRKITAKALELGTFDPKEASLEAATVDTKTKKTASAQTPKDNSEAISERVSADYLKNK